MKNYLKPVLNNIIFKSILFIIAYFLFITPIALVSRLVSINKLKERYSDRLSYWEDKN